MVEPLYTWLPAFDGSRITTLDLEYEEGQRKHNHQINTCDKFKKKKSIRVTTKVEDEI